MLHKYSRRPATTTATAPVVGWDHIASSAGRLELELGTEGLGAGPVQPGEALLVRVLTPNPGYERLELPSGETVILHVGDKVVCVAGHRQALRGFVGRAPNEVEVGTRLHLLSLGGIVGDFHGGMLDLGVPTSVEVIDRLGRDGRPLSLAEGAVAPRKTLGSLSPVVAVVGTCMSAGKSRAAAELVSSAVRLGLRVAAVKLTGVGCLRDVLKMKERGAEAVLSFLDAGLASTVDEPEIIDFANGLLHELGEVKPDLIIAEMGDGILGPYGVDRLLQDRGIRNNIRAVVFSATDHVGVWGGIELLKRWGLSTDVVTGPVTDSPAACLMVEQELGVPAVNACTDGHRLFEAVQPRVFS